MIPHGAVLRLVRLDPAVLEVDPTDHVEPIDPWAVAHYARLLAEQPDDDTDPILVVERAGGRRCVRRGRHRLAANLQAGRREILAMIYNA